MLMSLCSGGCDAMSDTLGIPGLLFLHTMIAESTGEMIRDSDELPLRFRRFDVGRVFRMIVLSDAERCIVLFCCVCLFV